jgi:ABC-type glycerol-3-phosphate transport system substrate-binding protein
VVTIWHTESNAKTKAAIDEIIADYEKANPGVKIKQEGIGWGSLGTKLTAAIAAGAPPDASHGQSYMERSLSAKGLLRPLDDVIASIGEDDILDVVKKLDYHDGHYYGLAHAIGVDTIIYRKDFYREAGVSEESPKTWKEWIEILKKLTVDTDGDGTPDRYGLDLAGPGFFINEEVYMWTGSNGGRLFDEKGRPTFTEKPVVEMLAFYKELNDCCLPPGWLGHGYLDNFVALATGKVASILGWGRGAYTFEKYAPDLVAAGDIGVYPSKPVGPSGTKFLTQLDCEPWMVFKDAKYPEEAADFLKFFYRIDNYRKYIQSVPVHFFPITKSLRQDAAYKATPDFEAWGFWVDGQSNVINNFEPKPLLMTEWDDLELPYIFEIGDSGILIDMVTAVVSGRKSPEAAAADAQDRAERLIEQLGYKKW